MHLQIAEQIRQTVADNGRLTHTLTTQWPAFCLGNVAPDVNAISRISRAASHFYDFPPLPEHDAYREMFAQYPQLADAAQLPVAQAVFVAGYAAHLLLDLIWLREIAWPYFFQAEHLGPPAQRRLLHFVLLAYLDTLALEALPGTAVQTLAHAHPTAWLPFVPDEVLADWRDRLVDQLQPGAPIHTVEIYAGRLGMSAAEFAAALHDPVWMADHVFGKLPVTEIQQIIQTAVPKSIEMMKNYLP
jgi:hypothetical protein